MSRRDLKQNRRVGVDGSFDGSFLPTYFPGCKLWLRSDLGITTGATFTWADQSGNGNNGTQSTAAQQPTVNASDASYGNRPTLSLASASAQFLNLAAVFPAQPFTAYIVGESTSGATNQFFFSDNTQDLRIFFNTTVFAIQDAANILTTTNSTRTKQAFAGVYNGASSALFINSSGSAAVSGNLGAANPTGSEQLGADGGGANTLNGKIAEVIVYNSAHTSTQIAQIFRYFNSLYGGGFA